MPDPPPWMYPRNFALGSYTTPLPFPLLPSYSSSPLKNDEELDAVVREEEAKAELKASAQRSTPATQPVFHLAPRKDQSWARAPAGFNCLNCRRKSKKCGGERPACNFCIEKGVDCYYKDTHSHLPEYQELYNKVLGSRNASDKRRRQIKAGRGPSKPRNVSAPVTAAEIDAQIEELIELGDNNKASGSNTDGRPQSNGESTAFALTPVTEQSFESEEGSNDVAALAQPSLLPAFTSSVPSKRAATSPLSPRPRRVSFPMMGGHEAEHHRQEAPPTHSADAGPQLTQTSSSLIYSSTDDRPPPSPTEMSELDIGPSVLRPRSGSAPALPTNIRSNQVNSTNLLPPPSAPPAEPNLAATHLPLLPIGALFPQILNRAGMTPGTMPSVNLFAGNNDTVPGLAALAQKFEAHAHIFRPRRMPSLGTPTPASRDPNALGLSLYPSPRAETATIPHNDNKHHPGPPNLALRRFPGPPVFVGPALIRPIAQPVPAPEDGPVAYPYFLPNSSWHPAPNMLPNNLIVRPPPHSLPQPPSPSPFAFGMPAVNMPHIPRGNSLHLTDHHVVEGPKPDNPVVEGPHSNLDAYDPKAPLSAGWPYPRSVWATPQ
ncbi:hypothetical protein Q8F55_004570 [Vanrija albida]|uniref:Zn(2)-C6 fungal-type domain-containing protein n=1 Tax=Vanrija albida TaxID=181172 RepID=A0ABR3Q7V9_9TREE